MSGLIAYPVPLGSSDRMAKLLLPSDLTRADVARIVAYLNALLFDGQP